MSELDKKISDEILKGRIKAIIKELNTSKTERILKHPLSAIFISFVLTTVIGTYLTFKFQSRSILIDRQKSLIQTRQNIVSEISSLTYERITRSELLGSSIRRRSEDLNKRKDNYDKSYFKWNQRIMFIQIQIRELIGEKYYSNVEHEIFEQKLLPRFKRIDDELTSKYDLLKEGKSFDYDEELIKKLIKECRKITEIEINYLWTVTNYKTSDKEIKAETQKLKIDLNKL